MSESLSAEILIPSFAFFFPLLQSQSDMSVFSSPRVTAIFPTTSTVVIWPGRGPEALHHDVILTSTPSVGAPELFSTQPKAFIADVLLRSMRQPQKLKYECTVAAQNNNNNMSHAQLRHSASKDGLNP